MQKIQQLYLEFYLLFLRVNMRNKLVENRAMTWRIYLLVRVKRRVIVLMRVSPKGARHATLARSKKIEKERIKTTFKVEVGKYV